MSKMSDDPPTDDDLAARRRDDLGRDLEVLLARLAESREAIVRLLADRSGDGEAVAEEAWDEEAVAEETWDDGTVAEEARGSDEIQYLEPRPFGSVIPLRSTPIAPEEPDGPLEPEASSPPVGVAEPLEPKPESDVTPNQLPSSLRRAGPPALELALIYREMARNGGEVRPEALPSEAVEGPATDGPELAATTAWALPEGIGPSSTRAPANGAGVASPRLIAAEMPTIAGASPRRVLSRADKVPGKAAAATTGPKPVVGARKLPGKGAAATTRPTTVGSVVLLTTVVSMLPTLVNVL
jgi:hypothetical protein